MCKKFTRGINETVKALIQKVSSPQDRKGQKPLVQKVSNLQNRKDQRPQVEKSAKAQTADVRYSYLDCLCDKALAPSEVNGSTLYQLLMVGCMVLFVSTANGVGHSGVSFLAQSR